MQQKHDNLEKRHENLQLEHQKFTHQHAGLDERHQQDMKELNGILQCQHQDVMVELKEQHVIPEREMHFEHHSGDIGGAVIDNDKCGGASY